MSCNIHTNAGILDVLAPDAEKIRIEDIARALSYICRFNGHVRFHYSVAQHSLLVSAIVERRHGRDLALTALMHDASEAYLGDMISPLKTLLPDFKRLESVLGQAIAEKFGLAHPEPGEVKLADLAVLAAEREQVLAPTDKSAWRELPPPPRDLVIKSQAPDKVMLDFLERFHKLSA